MILLSGIRELELLDETPNTKTTMGPNVTRCFQYLQQWKFAK